MGKWNEQENKSITFDVKMSEDANAFFERQMNELKEKEESFRERIRQLFKENVLIDCEAPEAVVNQVLTVFSIGYQCGWNDYYSLNEKEEGQ